MSIQNDVELEQVYNLLESGDPFKADELHNYVLSNNLGNPEVKFVSECLKFLKQSFACIPHLSSDLEKGEHLISTWKRFVKSYSKKGAQYETALTAVQCGIFRTALACYQSMLKDPDTVHKDDAFRRISVCQKMIGNYDAALHSLREANPFSQDSATHFAQLADCYALNGNILLAKTLFREAYYIDAQQIDHDLLISGLICSLYEKVLALGYSEKEAAEWLPVYGVLWGVLDENRELRNQEVAKLNQSIIELENDLKGVAPNPELLVPRLINRYFWLIDYHKIVKSEKSKIKQVLLKIKALDENIHNMYTT